jgi:hypothetical protein
MFGYIPWFVYLSFVMVTDVNSPVWVPYLFWVLGSVVHFKTIALDLPLSPNHLQILIKKAASSCEQKSGGAVNPDFCD